MKDTIISRWDMIRKTKGMMLIALFYIIAISFCLSGIIRKTTVFHQIIFIVLSFIFLMNFRRSLSYIWDIIRLRTRVFEGKIRKLVFGVDYEGKVKPIDYDFYEMTLKSGEVLRFPCAHDVLNLDIAQKVRVIFMKSTSDILKAEVFEEN